MATDQCGSGDGRRDPALWYRVEDLPFAKSTDCAANGHFRLLYEITAETGKLPGSSSLSGGFVAGYPIGVRLCISLLPAVVSCNIFSFLLIFNDIDTDLAQAQIEWRPMKGHG